MLRRSVIAGVLVGVVMLSGPAFAQEAEKPQEKPKEAAAAADPISGDWEGTVQMAGGPTAVWMSLKLDKETISGEIGNYEGSIPVTGTWADGKMTLSFTYVNGEPMVLTGAFKDGQLAGELDMNAGQMLATWTAKKKV